jgi:hypothetical protein
VDAEQRKLGRSLREPELLAVMANVIADTVLPRWKEMVRKRRTMLATGTGFVHGRRFDLAKDFGITNAPWDVSSAAPTAGVTPEMEFEGDEPVPSGADATPAPAEPSAGDDQSDAPADVEAPPPASVRDALGQGADDLAIRYAILSGIFDPAYLTRLIYNRRSPRDWRNDGRPRHQRTRDWLNIRDQLVQPALWRAWRRQSSYDPNSQQSYYRPFGQSSSYRPLGQQSYVRPVGQRSYVRPVAQPVRSRPYALRGAPRAAFVRRGR